MVFSFSQVQIIPAPLSDVWRFFSSADNLTAITPASMQFRIISKYHGATIYPGQIIEYKIKPFWGISWYWMTEITQVENEVFFVDEQRYGPYSLWHHQHHFKKVEGGIEMTDIVHYKIPYGILGDFVNKLYVGKELKRIFEFRKARIEEIFGKNL